LRRVEASHDRRLGAPEGRRRKAPGDALGARGARADGFIRMRLGTPGSKTHPGLYGDAPSGAKNGRPLQSLLIIIRLDE
jgi:hypothetical protein